MKHKLATRSRLIGALAVLLTLSVATGLFLLWHTPAPREITVKGSSEQMGKQYGQALRFKMQLLSRVYLDRIVCQKNPTLIATQRKKAVQSLVHWPKPYLQELEATSLSSGMDRGALAYANCFLDLGPTRAGCRSAVVSSTNLFLHAHNLDWDSLGGLARWTTCIIRRHPADGRLATVSVSFPGIIGALDIINEKGLALSFNQLGSSRGNAQEPVFIMMRRIAENCKSFDEARDQILNAPPGMPFIITLSHGPSRSAAIFQRERDSVAERPLAKDRMGACNVSQAKAGKVIITGLDRVLESTQLQHVTDLQAVMKHPDVLMSCNIYSVIFDFPHNRLLLASGSTPAAVGSFRKFRLFPTGETHHKPNNSAMDQKMDLRKFGSNRMAAGAR